MAKTPASHARATARPASPDDDSYLKGLAAAVALVAVLVATSLIFNKAFPNNPIQAMLSAGSHSAASAASVEFVDLGSFTAHMQDEDQTLHTSLALKLTRPGLAEKAQAHLQEIQHHVNMVLQSKRVSELLTVQDKENLARQLKERVEHVMGFRKTPPVGQPDGAPVMKENGVAAVLFTSFIIRY